MFRRQQVTAHCAKFVRLRGTQFFRYPDEAMKPVFARLAQLGIEPENHQINDDAVGSDVTIDALEVRAAELRTDWATADVDEEEQTAEASESMIADVSQTIEPGPEKKRGASKRTLTKDRDSSGQGVLFDITEDA